MVDGILQPRDAGLLQRKAAAPRARERPGLVDVGHDPHVGPDGLAHRPHALRLALGRRLAAHPELDRVEAGLGVTARGRRQLGGRQAVPEPVARVGRHAVAKAAEQARERLAERLAVGVPDGDVQRRQRQVQQAAGPHPVAAPGERVPGRLGLEHAQTHEMLAQLVGRHSDRRHEIRPRVDDVADALDAVRCRDPRQHVPVRIDRALARGVGTLDGHPQHTHRHLRDLHQGSVLRGHGKPAGCAKRSRCEVAPTKQMGLFPQPAHSSSRLAR